MQSMRQQNRPETPALAAMPPMGWNSWNAFGRNINEAIVRETADAIVRLGLRTAGYRYVVIDDCWHGGRDRRGRLFPSPEKFPGGIKALADHVHERGLKFGIYSCAGEKTCGGEPGSHRHEEQDAETFAAWGVDYLKEDYCFAPDDLRAAMRRYATMGQALQATGRPIVFSICEWGRRAPWLWGAKAGGHLWRTAFDVVDLWDAPRNVPPRIGILTAIDRTEGLDSYAGPGHWNDPDMLVIGLHGQGAVGGPGCTEEEYRTQMSMWCMLAAPLMLGCDIRSLGAADLAIIANPEVLAVDQDPLGKPGIRVARQGGLEVWQKPLRDEQLAVALLNRGEQAAAITAEWKLLGLNPDQPRPARDLWLHQDLGVFRNRLRLDVAPHATRMLKLTVV